MFSWYYIEGILIQSCYTLLIVLGLSILTGYTGMFSFGHAGFVCIGAYVSILCTMAFGLPYWLSLIIAGLAAMLLGAGLGKITLNLKGDYFCIATLGVGEAIRLIFNNLQLTINVGGLCSVTGTHFPTAMSAPSSPRSFPRRCSSSLSSSPPRRC